MAAVFVLRSLYRARHILRWPLAQLSWAPGRGHRLTPTDDELYQRTRISLLQRESPQAMYIDSYSSRGFVVNGNRVLGPCALLPHSVVQWNVGSHQDITEGSFSLFWMLEPRIEKTLLIPVGRRTSCEGEGRKTEAWETPQPQGQRNGKGWSLTNEGCGRHLQPELKMFSFQT
uniref:NADH:ubiquinone oxidoreductase complex assembly factor 3 n=2 Tax=Sus scrofa TaxID=9823 RepID=A0A8D1QND7_PIG